MPYNTRRVSLSLPSLGIQLPGSNSASRAHRSPSTTTITTTTTTTTTIRTATSPTSPASSASSASAAASSSSSSSDESSPKTSENNSTPPAKRVKRSHTQNSASAASASSNVSASPASQHRRTSSATTSNRRRTTTRIGEATPPPSPGDPQIHSKIDFEGIKDDIVVGVLQQLESTGNRPHLIKELAAVLVNRLRAVESSANPTAIISCRLTNYLKRPWTALAPCPLAKEQVTTHPRRVYYFLTTCPRQEIPEFSGATTTPGGRLVSPSASSADDEDVALSQHDEQEQDMMDRDRLSPSPELDLSTSKYFPDYNSTSEFSFSFQPFGPSNSAQAPSNHNLSHNRRGASPTLENDEREFTQTVSVMQQRMESEQAEFSSASSISSPGSSEVSTPDTGLTTIDADSELPDVIEQDETEESAALRNSEAAAALFGPTMSSGSASSQGNVMPDFSSPMLRPTLVSPPVISGTFTSQLSIQPKNPAAPPIPPSRVEKPVTVPLIDTSLRSGPTAAGSSKNFDSAEKDMFDALDAWGELKSPECVELAELDDLFGGHF